MKVRRYKKLSFPSFVFGWTEGKLYCLVEEKNGKIEYKVYINLLSYPY